MKITQLYKNINFAKIINSKSIIIFVASSIFITFSIGLCYSIRDFGISSNQATGWVQAIATILTIASAFAIVEIQFKKNRESNLENQRLSLIAKMNGILAVVQVAKFHATNIKNNISPERTLDIYQVYHKSITSGIVNVLSAAPIYEIESTEAVRSLLSLKDRFVFLESTIEAYIAGPNGNKEALLAIDAARERMDFNKVIELQAIINQSLYRNVEGVLTYIFKDIEVLERTLTHSEYAKDQIKALPTAPNTLPTP